MPEVLRYAAFATRPDGGNPAGVVLDADTLDERAMQQIAAEVGYSETAFVTRRGAADGTLAVRYFSPVAEVPFCGHATIATAIALTERHGPGDLAFHTAAGRIEVATVEAERGYRATLRSVPTHSRPASPDDVAAALMALRWSTDDLDPTFPPHVAFAGNDHLVLATSTRQRLRDLDYDFSALRELMTLRGWTTLQLFWREDAGTYHSRNPFPVGGVIEDPATGAAAAALGAYLRQIDHASEGHTLRIVQGEDMGRRSELQVSILPDSRVSVSGTAVRLPQ